jgi:hypothetical protein
MHGDAGGSANLARQASPVIAAKPRFADGDPGYTPQPDSAVDPGKGAIPVDPLFVSGQGLGRAFPIADDANWRVK